MSRRTPFKSYPHPAWHTPTKSGPKVLWSPSFIFGRTTLLSEKFVISKTPRTCVPAPIGPWFVRRSSTTNISSRSCTGAGAADFLRRGVDARHRNGLADHKRAVPIAANRNDTGDDFLRDAQRVGQ